jgi:hypothetical protein
MPRRFFVVTMLIGVLGIAEGRAAEPAKIFKAGAYSVDITPTKFPVIVNGMMTQRTADKAFDPLHARALVLDDGLTRVAVVIVDSCLLPRELLDQAKEMAAKATGIPTDRMLISATHTHSAPSATPALGTPADPEYPGFLIPQIARSIQLAADQLRPAKVGWTVVNDPRHTASRRSIRRSDRIDKDPFGEATVRANMYSPEPIGPSGPVDDEISLFAVQTAEGKPLALLANYATHYYGTPPVSADYYGRFCDQFAKLAAPAQQDVVFVGMMSQGTSGDIHGRGAGNIDNYAKEVAEVAFEAYQKIQYHSWVPLTMREVKQTFKRRIPNEARLAWAKQIDATLQGRLPRTYPEIYAREQLYLAAEPERELKLQALAIGDLGITAIPNEVFSLTGIKLKLQSPFTQTFNIELANGCEGYIPPPEQHVLGGYTTWAARTAGLEVDAEPKIVEMLLSMLEQISGKSRKQIEKSQSVYSESVLKSKPLGYWRMAELAGRQAADASGNSHAAKYEDGVVFYLDGPPATDFSSADQVNRCAHFAGGRMHAELPKIGDTYSAEFWFWNGFPNDARAITGYLFSHGPNGDASVGDHLGISGSFLKPGRLIFFNGNERNQVVSGRTIIEPRTWNHVVLVRDGRQVRVYLNGNAEPELTGDAEVSLANECRDWFLGGRSDNFTNLEGKLDEAAIYDRALTPDEVAGHYRESDLPPKANTPSADDLTWQPLLKGNNLDGWYTYLQQQGKNSDRQRVFQVEDGVLHIYKDVPNGTTMPFGYLCTEQEYSHYRLRFQYRWGKNRFAPRTGALRDSGVLYHCVGPDGAFLGVWPRCVEYQVQEGDTGDIYAVGARISATVDGSGKFQEPSSGGKTTTLGSVQGIARIIHREKLEVEGWNTCEIIVEGDKATHILNGKINNHCYDIRQPDPNNPQQLVPLTKGRILLQAEGAEIFYRNLEIALLPELQAPTEDAQSAVPQAHFGAGLAFQATSPR